MNRSFAVTEIHGDIVNTPHEAILFFQKTIANQPHSVNVLAAIDTCISWSHLTPGAWRPMDLILRATYPNVKGSVVTPNFLQGAMIANGLMAASMLVNSIHLANSDNMLWGCSIRESLAYSSVIDKLKAYSQYGCMPLVIPHYLFL